MVITAAQTAATAAESPLQADRALTEYRCIACGYGIRVRRLPESCPMCQTDTWGIPGHEQQLRAAAGSHERELARR
jgi:hypothetical protein